MAYLERDQLLKLPFKFVGNNVQISERASFNRIHNDSFISNNVRIDDFAIISGKVSFGSFVHIAPFALLDGGDLGIEIGDFSGVSYRSSIITRSDDFMGLSLSNPTVGAQYKITKNESVKIGRHVRIGMHSIVLPGSQIEDGCSLALQSVFQGKSETLTLYKGNPAKEICKLSRRCLDLEEPFLSNLKREH